MALGKDGDSIRIFAGILDTPWVLELGPLFQMNPYPPPWARSTTASPAPPGTASTAPARAT